jgi:2,3-bisphosphoglycerate-independent phosphoglycerate mutase
LSVNHILFLFLDGVGLGADAAESNPFVTAEIPTLTGLLNGRRPLANTPRTETRRSVFVPTDACLGVPGPPQSTILTGLNVSERIGQHWGPKPNAAIAELLRAESVFHSLKQNGQTAALLNAYPQRYFDSIASRRRNYSAIPLAVTAAGLALFTNDQLRAGRALSADFTGDGWPDQSAPRYTAREAGHRLAQIAGGYDFSFFEYWISDYVGHRGSLDEAVATVQRLDAVLAGLLEAWDDDGLIVITSDHGNLEDLSHSHHTLNRVPTFIIGADRHALAYGLEDLTHFAPTIVRLLA